MVAARASERTRAATAAAGVAAAVRPDRGALRVLQPGQFVPSAACTDAVFTRAARDHRSVSDVILVRQKKVEGKWAD